MNAEAKPANGSEDSNVNEPDVGYWAVDCVGMQRDDALRLADLVESTLDVEYAIPTDPHEWLVLYLDRAGVETIASALASVDGNVAEGLRATCDGWLRATASDAPAED